MAAISKRLAQEILFGECCIIHQNLEQIKKSFEVVSINFLKAPLDKQNALMTYSTLDTYTLRSFGHDMGPKGGVPHTFQNNPALIL